MKDFPFSIDSVGLVVTDSNRRVFFSYNHKTKVHDFGKSPFIKLERPYEKFCINTEELLCDKIPVDKVHQCFSEPSHSNHWFDMTKVEAIEVPLLPRWMLIDREMFTEKLQEERRKAEEKRR